MNAVLFPAIDLRSGRCVRLTAGEFDQETIYGTDPVALAQSFEEAGAEWIHVVDLDAALTGEPRNKNIILKLVSTVEASVQVGGGVRSVEMARSLFDGGVGRVVMGTAAIEAPELVSEVSSYGPVAVGLDIRGSHLSLRGWTQGSGITVRQSLDLFDGRGVDAFVVTRIERDGTLDGPDIDSLAEILEITDVDVVASGGVGSLGDLKTLADLRKAGRGLAGVIVGRAIYERAFDVAEAIEVLQELT